LIGAAPERLREAVAFGCWNAGMENVTTKQVLADLAFTAGAALATGGVVSVVAAALILIFAR
jgi:hypothetical protein